MLISIHALLAESDITTSKTAKKGITFLSTLSLRRATTRAPPYLDTLVNFYPRSPCGERPAAPKTRRAAWPFLSTLSLRRATHFTGWISCISPNFYPRSPCGERRYSQPPETDFRTDFYPRSPCGERRPCPPQSGYCSNFYPRSPCGERPCAVQPLPGFCQISIHALLAESDWPGTGNGWPVPHFYPRSPCGERPGRCGLCLPQQDFYPRSPCGERPSGFPAPG